VSSHLQSIVASKSYGYWLLALLTPIAIEHQVSGTLFPDVSLIPYTFRHTVVSKGVGLRGHGVL